MEEKEHKDITFINMAEATLFVIIISLDSLQMKKQLEKYMET